MCLPQRGEPEFWVSFLGAKLPPTRQVAPDQIPVPL